MVFCYKIITESPRRSYNGSPRRRDKTWDVPAAIGNLLNEDKELLDSIPEREWRLLSALLQKRDEELAREKLADQFRNMWIREREAKEMVDAETSQQYRQFLNSKRQQESSWLRRKQQQRTMEQAMKESQIMDNIKFKERKSECLRANYNDKKNSNILDRAIDLEARIFLAADRRQKHEEADEWKKHLDLLDWRNKSNEANRRRRAMLRDATKRIATYNALTSWESSQNRLEVDALDIAKRAEYAIHVALTEAKRKRLARAKMRRMERARRVAEFTSTLRDAVKSGRFETQMCCKSEEFATN